MDNLYDLNAEAMTLAAVMLDTRAAWDVVPICRPVDFSDPRHEGIMRALVSLSADGRPTDPVSVVAELEKHDYLTRSGGAAYVFEVFGQAATWTNAGYYAEIVASRAVRRRLVDAGGVISSLGRGSGSAARDDVERARAVLDGVTHNAGGEIRPIGDTIGATVDGLREPGRFTPSPWPQLDELIGGFRPGCLYVIGARPGSGKTIMGLNIAAQLCRSGAVAFSSLEMSEEDLHKRLISQDMSIRIKSLMDSCLQPWEEDRIAERLPALRQMPLFIDDRAEVTLTQIKAFARSVSHKGKFAGVVVDYLQLIPGGGKGQARHEFVGELSRGLKILARDLDVPVFALSQLNREVESRPGGKPGMNDLRESGSIEQDADVILLLQRDKEINSLEVSIPKNRHGTPGEISLAWEGHYMRVTSV